MFANGLIVKGRAYMRVKIEFEVHETIKNIEDVCLCFATSCAERGCLITYPFSCPHVMMCPAATPDAWEGIIKVISHNPLRVAYELDVSEFCSEIKNVSDIHRVFANTCKNYYRCPFEDVFMCPFSKGCADITADDWSNVITEIVK